jgi:hypothetical protein
VRKTIKNEYEISASKTVSFIQNRKIGAFIAFNLSTPVNYPDKQAVWCRFDVE